MGSYISSNQNRFYVGKESAYGQAASVGSNNRFPAVHLAISQTLEQGTRRDKTGSRTFIGVPATSRRFTSFQVQTYLTSWGATPEPSYGPLFQAALGAAAISNSGLIVGAVVGANGLQTSTPHGLRSGCGVSFNNELRFVLTVPDPSTMILNAPFSVMPQAGSALGSAITYSLATGLPSVSIFDFWDPLNAVSRVLVGAAVNQLEFIVNGDFHEFLFQGPAADVLDSTSFTAGQGGLSSFPVESPPTSFDYSIVPGHLGEVWLGGSPANRFFTLTDAKVAVNNSIELRNREFGASLPRAIAPGPRHVTSGFSLFAQDDVQTKALYQVARARQPIPAMIQLGQQQGQLLGIYLPNVVPEVPRFDDSDTRLQWDFVGCKSQGVADDEIYVAFA
jgi:hypothetical protein